MIRKLLITFALALAGIHCPPPYPVRPYICLPGEVCYKGFYFDSETTQYASFQEIRYAMAPTGDLRFKDPVKHVPEKGTYDVGYKSSLHCPQRNQQLDGSSIIDGKEDCLFLNVYVPKSAMDNEDASLPVMVWIKVKSKILLELIFVINQIVTIIDRFFKNILLTFDQRQLMFKKNSEQFRRQIYTAIFHFRECSNYTNVEVERT